MLITFFVAEFLKKVCGGRPHRLVRQLPDAYNSARSATFRGGARSPCRPPVPRVRLREDWTVYAIGPAYGQMAHSSGHGGPERSLKRNRHHAVEAETFYSLSRSYKLPFISSSYSFFQNFLRRKATEVSLRSLTCLDEFPCHDLLLILKEWRNV